MYQNIQQVGAQSTQNTQYSTGLTLGTGVRIAATEKNYLQGSILQTGGTLDMAITGQGFFQITMPDGTLGLHARRLLFARQPGQRRDRERLPAVAGNHDPDRRAVGHHRRRRHRVGDDGRRHDKRRTVGQIQLANFINVGGLQPTGNNLLVESGASGAPQVGTPNTNGLGSLTQGSVETSNVNTVTELVNMIQCQRAYEMNSKAISSTDQMMQYLTQNLQ